MAELAGGNDGALLTAAQTHDLIGNCGTLSASALSAGASPACTSLATGEEGHTAPTLACLLPTSSSQQTDGVVASERTRRWPTFFMEADSFESAAARLLASQYIEEANEWRSTDGSYRPIDTADCTTRCIEPCAPCFESHLGISLPDSPPPSPTREERQPDASPMSSTASAAGMTEVHRFTLHSSIAEHINAELREEATSRRTRNDGIRRSNVGGFHSEEELFTSTTSGWYGRVHNVLIEALRMLEDGSSGADAPGAEALRQKPAPDGPQSPPPAATATTSSYGHVNRMKVSGWMNVSTTLAFNTLHDHGDALWAAVYFVDAGSAAADGDEEETVGPAAATATAYSGALLLKTQLAPWTSDYAFFTIKPRAGDLWIFPGYVPHAVLPRALPSAGEVDVGKEAQDESPRISIACNVAKPAAAGGASREEEDALRAMRRLLRGV